MSTRRDVLDALRANRSTGVSGQVLAERLGISRVAIGKHVTALRDAGYVIDARPGEGYRLIATPDAPLPLEVAPLVTDPFWRRIEGAAETDSTNDDARALARGGAEEGVAVVAGRQRAGRGRLGRQWSSPEGGVYLSVILRPSMSPVDAGPLPLVIALGVARGLQSLGVSALLKWPNDVFAGDGKVAGVLLEMNAEADCISWIVAGVGVNVRRTEDAPPGAGYVADHVKSPSAPLVAAAVLNGIGSAYRQWAVEGFGRLAEEFAERHRLQGECVTVRNPTGGVIAAGQVFGIDAMGRLGLEDDGRRTFVSSGDVTLRDDCAQ